MNSSTFLSEVLSEVPSPVVRKTQNQKLYLNRGEILEQKHVSELNRCKKKFDEFLEKINIECNSCFSKILEAVKVPFISLPSMHQIKSFFHNYISRERERKYVKKGFWNQKELKVLLWALVAYSEHLGQKIDDFSDADWQEISELLPSTNAIKCKAKWFSINKSKFIQKKWTQEEDDQLFSFMNNLGTKNKVSWNDLAINLNNSFYKGEFVRTGRHCRDRWVHHLNPKLCRLQWTRDEDLKILRYVMEHGKKWANLSKIMQNRNEDFIRNRFKKLMRNFRKQDKNIKNSKIMKAERNLLSNLIQDLSLKNTDENGQTKELPRAVGRKSHREQFIRVSEGIKEEENQYNEGLISLKKQVKSENQSETRSTPKSLCFNTNSPENTPIDSLSKEKDQPKANLNGNMNLPLASNENIDNAPEQMNNLFRQMTALQNQLIYQDMMMHQMKVMMNNYFWSSAMNNFAP